MTEAEIYRIGAGRLAGWLNELVADHATPVLLLGVGHDKKCGATSICVPKDLSDADILRYLKKVVAKMEESQ